MRTPQIVSGFCNLFSSEFAYENFKARARNFIYSNSEFWSKDFDIHCQRNPHEQILNIGLFNWLMSTFSIDHPTNFLTWKFLQFFEIVKNTISIQKFIYFSIWFRNHHQYYRWGVEIEVGCIARNWDRSYV